MSEFEPCPECESENATRVKFTWWGGLIGPRLFTHVKCDDCGTTFNGRTGKSNNVAIALYLIVPAVLVFIVTFIYAFMNAVGG